MLKLKQKNQYVELLKDTTQTLDLFAQPPIFRILKKNRFTTLIGHLFTLAIAALCIIYFFFSIKDLLSQGSPSVVFNEVQLIESDPVYLSKHNFTFVITLTKLSLSSLSTYNRDFQIQIQNCKRQRNMDPQTGALINVTSSCVTYDLERCNATKHFPTEAQQSYFKNINLTLLLCPNAEQWDSRSFQLQGVTVATNYQYLTVKASACQNSTNYTGCNSNTTITAGLASGYYAVYISDTLNQLNNAGNPFSQIINLQYTTFSITSSKEMMSFYRPTKVSSDTGLIFKDYEEYDAIMQSSISQTQNIYNNQYLIYHTITLDQKSQVYDRTYQKLQQILGSIGGFWQVLYFLSQILITPIVFMMMNLQMANKIFQFVYPQEQVIDQSNPVDDNLQLMSPQISARRRETTKMKQSSIFKAKSIHSPSNHHINDSKKMKYFVKKRTDSLNLGFKEILLMICGCRSKEKQLINYATDKILQKLDVAYILKKLFELEKMKGLLLDQEQIKLFQYLPKPNIPVNLFDQGNENKIKELESVQQFKFILSEEKTELVKITEAFQSYMMIKGKNQLSRIDQILISQLDEEVLNLFQSIDKGETKLNQIVSEKVLEQVFEDSKQSRNNMDIEENFGGLVLPRQQ